MKKLNNIYSVISLSEIRKQNILILTIQAIQTFMLGFSRLNAPVHRSSRVLA